jgi:hypothetical protein
MSQKRKAKDILSGTGLANTNNLPKRGEHKYYSTRSYTNVKLKNNLAPTKEPIRHLYNKGNRFKRVAVHISDYSKLVIGETYHIGTGKVGNHAYYFTGTFDGVDEKGDAIFKNYSQKNNNGEKYKDVKTVTVKPLSRQKEKNESHTYKLKVRTNLPRNIKNVISSFLTKSKSKRGTIKKHSSQSPNK